MVAVPVDLAAPVVANVPAEAALVMAADLVRAAAADLVAGDLLPSRSRPTRFR